MIAKPAILLVCLLLTFTIAGCGYLNASEAEAIRPSNYITGYNTDALHRADVDAVIHEAGFTPVLMNFMPDRPPKVRSCVCVCNDASHREWLVVVSPSKTITVNMQLGVDNRLTYDQMKDTLKRQGLQGVEAQLTIYLPRNSSHIYWRYSNSFYNLDGSKLSVAQSDALMN